MPIDPKIDSVRVSDRLIRIHVSKLKAVLELLHKGKTSGISNKELKKVIPELFIEDKK